MANIPNIDFITVSRNAEHIQRLSQSIGLSLGGAFPHKIIVMDGNRHDLFTGYNAAAAQTSGEILVFLHDDVQLLCNALAFTRPFQLLQSIDTGFIGICGSRILSAAGTWWGGDLTREQSYQNCRGLVFHGSPNEFGMHALIWPGGSAEFGQVLVVDGVLLMCHRRTFNRLNGFDAGTYQGFHFYDVDTTFRAHQLGLKNYVAPVPILHGSLGKFNDAWEKNRLIFVEKYQSLLPCSL